MNCVQSSKFEVLNHDLNLNLIDCQVNLTIVSHSFACDIKSRRILAYLSYLDLSYCSPNHADSWQDRHSNFRVHRPPSLRRRPRRDRREDFHRQNQERNEETGSGARRWISFQQGSRQIQLLPERSVPRELFLIRYSGFCI